MALKPSYQELFGARAFLRYLKASESIRMQYAVVAWFRQESGSISRVIGNNPFNIRPGAASMYASGTREGPGGTFLRFATLNRGFIAAAVVLKALSPSYGYDHVIDAAQRGQPHRFLGALATSSWSATHYGIMARAFPRGMDNHLIVIYRELIGALPD
jgi:hypothetical protein